MKNILIVILILITGFISCEKDNIESEIIIDSKLREELLNSPDSLAIEENNLILTTYLWRDFMPGTHDGNGSDMICVSQLLDTDSIDIISTITLKKLYVINDDKIWTSLNIQTQESESYAIRSIVRNGPKWGPIIPVDVICEFESSGTVHRIIAKSQLINRTD